MRKISTTRAFFPRVLGGLLMRVWLWGAVLFLVIAGAVGCTGLGYYSQSVSGHLSMLNAAKPISTWLADPGTPPELRLNWSWRKSCVILR
jgi:predicted aminopeptidase